MLVHYGQAEEEAQAVVAEIRGFGGRAETLAADLAQPDGARALARNARRIIGDRLDVRVVNAGIATSKTLEETTVEDFDRLYAVNVRAPFFLV